MRELAQQKGRRVGLIASGGNIDRDIFAAVLLGQTPAV
jgi:threonine dehydratase